jgi:hypothetical protein
VACLVGLSAAGLGAGCAQEDDAHRLRPLAGTGSPAEAAADEALADSTLLTLDDFPASWRALPGPPEDNVLGRQEEADLARCLGTDGEVFDTDLPHAGTPTFLSPAGDTVSARVSLAPDDNGPRRAIEALRGTGAPDCYAEAVQTAGMFGPEGAPTGVEVGTVSGVPIPYAASGNTTVAWRMSVPISAEGQQVNIYVDVVVVRVDRALITFSFQSQISPYDRDQSEHVVSILVDRVTEAVAEET